MKKNILSEEYRRMSKLAGIPITEQVEKDLETLKEATTKTEKSYVKGINKSAEQSLRTFIKSEILEELKKEDSKNTSIREAKKKKKSEEKPAEDITIEEPIEDTTEVNLDVTDQGFGDDMSMGGGSGDTKKMFGKLTDAFEAAKEFGDEKLTQQMANTIKYFNDNVILNTGR